MIAPTARLRIERIPLECLQVKETQQRYRDRLIHYLDLFLAHPDMYAGVLDVVPSDTHPGMYCLLNGHHRYVASIMTGRKDALCLIIEDGDTA